MNRRWILSISAMTAAGLALLPGSAVAQQKSLKETLVGTWTLVSNQSTPANSKGIIVFDAGGRYVEVNGDPNRPRFKSAGQPTGEELAAATLGHFAANLELGRPTKLTRLSRGTMKSLLDPIMKGPM